MTIENIKLTDKFHVWVAATNLILEEINREIVLEAKQKLKTLDKSTLVSAINELVDNKLGKNENINLPDNDIIIKTLLSKTKIQIGSEGNKNTYIEFYDDKENLYRKFLFDENKQKWFVEDGNGKLNEIITKASNIDGNEQHIILKRLPNEDFKKYTGLEGTLSYNLVTKEVRIHDGFTAGGLSLINNNITTNKVSTSSNDVNAGYLIEKLKAGNGLQIREDNIRGNNNLTISSYLYDEFAGSKPNNYIRRNKDNNKFEYISKDQLIIDLDVSKTYNTKQDFIDNIILKNNIYTYVTTINSDINIIINDSLLDFVDGINTFEVIMNVTKQSKIVFKDNIVWKDTITPKFDKLGYYFIKFRSFDGIKWFGSVEGYYQ